MTPNRERKAAERQRKIAAGLQRMELWVHPGDRLAVVMYWATLQKRRNKSKQTNGKGTK